MVNHWTIYDCRDCHWFTKIPGWDLWGGYCIATGHIVNHMENNNEDCVDFL